MRVVLDNQADTPGETRPDRNQLLQNLRQVALSQAQAKARGTDNAGVINVHQRLKNVVVVFHGSSPLLVCHSFPAAVHGGEIFRGRPLWGLLRGQAPTVCVWRMEVTTMALPCGPLAVRAIHIALHSSPPPSQLPKPAARPIRKISPPTAQ